MLRRRRAASPKWLEAATIPGASLTHEPCPHIRHTAFDHRRGAAFAPDPGPGPMRTETEHKRWEHFEHMADLGVRGHGATIEEAFEQTALALSAAVSEPGSVRPTVPVGIHCEAPDRELLLVDWLNALVYEMATRDMLFARFEVRIDRWALEATAWGEPIDRARHRPAVEVKGATLTALAVSEATGGGWVAQCVVDV